MQYYAIAGEGPWQELLVTREPYTDGRLNAGMRLVDQQPTGVTYTTWRAAVAGIDAKNRAIFAGR